MVSLVAVGTLSTAFAWPVFFGVLRRDGDRGEHGDVHRPGVRPRLGSFALAEPVGLELIAGFMLILVSLCLVLGIAPTMRRPNVTRFTEASIRRSSRYSAGMRAALKDRYGTPDVVHLEEVPKPTPGEGEILVRVHAASVNRADLDGIQPGRSSSACSSVSARPGTGPSGSMSPASWKPSARV